MLPVKPVFIYKSKHFALGSTTRVFFPAGYGVNNKIKLLNYLKESHSWYRLERDILKFENWKADPGFTVEEW